VIGNPTLIRKVMMRTPGLARRPVMIFLQTVVVCTVLCLCLSTTPEPGWWARQMGRLFQEKYRGPVALDHEQTIAVVTHNGPDDTIDRLDNN